MNGQEHARRGRDVGPIGKRMDLAGCATDRDRERGQRGARQGVQRHPERGRAGERPDPELDQVGGVVAVAGAGGVRISPVRLGEEVARGPGIVRVRRLVRAVIVVQPVLVQEFALPVGGGARDEDRLSVPDAGVGELRRDRGRSVQDRGPGARPGSRVERSAKRVRRGAQRQRSRGNRRDSRCEKPPAPHHPNITKHIRVMSQLPRAT